MMISSMISYTCIRFKRFLHKVGPGEPFQEKMFSRFPDRSIKVIWFLGGKV